MASKRAFVRPYEALTDYEDVVDLCKVTAHPSIHAAADILPYIYAIPYVLLERGAAFVLDAGGGNGVPEKAGGELECGGEHEGKMGGGREGGGGGVVGYIIGTINTQRFVERYKSEYIPSLPSTESTAENSSSGSLRKVFVRILHDPTSLLHAEHPDLLQRYPAHLHINILPSHQRKGYGGELMKVFLDHLKSEGVSGVHLGMRADNSIARKFYEMQGFEETRQLEEDQDTTWMVRRLN